MEQITDSNIKKLTPIVDHTKTNTDRYVYLIPDALEILETLPRDSDYIFTREGKRLTARQINYVLEKYAERNNLQTKSSHKLRKTYTSMCHAQGIPVDFIRKQLGHASLATTFQYLFNPLTEDESYQMLTDALSRKNTATPGNEPGDAATSVISIEEFRNRKPAVPKKSSNVPKFSNAKNNGNPCAIRISII